MKDAEKFERSEDLKNSENLPPEVSEISQEMVSEFIELLKSRSRPLQNPSN